MIGLGRMGANLARRVTRAGHECVVFDRNPGAVSAPRGRGDDRVPTATKRSSPRWPRLGPSGSWSPRASSARSSTTWYRCWAPGDIVIDGGNSFYGDDIERAGRLAERGIHYVDCGTSGGVWGLERGYSLMIGGSDEAVSGSTPSSPRSHPGRGEAEPTPNRTSTSTADQGYYHCGPPGAGHFVKMVHNGVEYGMMAALAEGLNIIKHAGIGLADADHDAETTPLRQPERYQYDIDVAEVAEVWRRGAVISSWLVDLMAAALTTDPDLAKYAGQVSDSGEGRWTAIAAIDEGVPAPVITAAFQARFSSRGMDTFGSKVLSAMREQFGGHAERTQH